MSPLSDATPGRFLSLANHRHVFGHEQLSSDEIDARRAEADAAGALVLPVHVHDHSGLKFSLKEFADPWDSACCGVWIASQEEMAADEMTEDDARSAIEGTLKRYSDYCNGWAYRYVVYGANNEEEDAVGGYLGCHHTMTGLLIEAGNRGRDRRVTADSRLGMQRQRVARRGRLRTQPTGTRGTPGWFLPKQGRTCRRLMTSRTRG